MPTTDPAIASFFPQSGTVFNAAIDVQTLVELRLIATLLHQGLNLTDDNLDTLRQDLFQTVIVQKIP